MFENKGPENKLNGGFNGVPGNFNSPENKPNVAPGAGGPDGFGGGPVGGSPPVEDLMNPGADLVETEMRRVAQKERVEVNHNKQKKKRIYRFFF